MKIGKRILPFGLSFLFLINCSSNINEQKVTEVQGALQSTFQKDDPVFELPDSLFAYHNIENSLVVRNFKQDGHTIYTDTTESTKFHELDSIQKIKLLIPLILESSVSLPNDVSYINAYFISKQTKIDEFTPIVVWVPLLGYAPLFYILLDKDLNYVAYFTLNGILCGSPTTGPNSTTILCPIRHSFLKGNEIFTYEIQET